MKQLWALAGVLAWSAAIAAPLREGHLRLDPHAYAGPRGGEPRQQLVAQTVQRFSSPDPRRPWEVSVHLEGETMGRRDLSLDVDRAWIFLPVSEEGAGVALGRVHPWDLSRDPNARRPWGLLAGQSPQNYGVLLGYGFDHESPEPSPILLGWVGAHFWSDVENRSPVAWGVSATPFFVPSLGSEVALSPTESAAAGRFGRRPPGTVEVNGEILPLRYEIDKSRVFQDVIFNPQVMAQGRLKSDLGETWGFLSRAPSPEATFDTTEYLRVTNESLNAVAIVRPKFVPRWTSGITHVVPLGTQKVLGSLYAASDHWWGAEAGLANDFFSASLAHELAWGPIERRDGESDGRYLDWLLRTTAQLPAGDFLFYGGAATHLSQGDVWLRLGNRYTLSPSAHLDLGADLFSGPDRSYFGEWRTNDRFSLVFAWEVGI